MHVCCCCCCRPGFAFNTFSNDAYLEGLADCVEQGLTQVGGAHALLRCCVSFEHLQLAVLRIGQLHLCVLVELADCVANGLTQVGGGAPSCIRLLASIAAAWLLFARQMQRKVISASCRLHGAGAHIGRVCTPL
jgi:hypothetical protein